MPPKTSEQIAQFRNLLRSLDNERDKFDACVRMRDELLHKQIKIWTLISDAEEVMTAECVRYKESKGQWRDHSEADAKKWEQFTKAASRVKKECLAPLTKVSAFWNSEKVQHYEWTSMGEKFCKVLGTAASRVPDWTEASIKLNQSILRRISTDQPNRNPLNPVNQVDVEILCAWRTKDPFVRGRYTYVYTALSDSNLPTGYVMDRYGLIVPQPQSVVQTEETRSMDQIESLEGNVTIVPPTANAHDRATASAQPISQINDESTCSTPLSTPPQSPIDPSGRDQFESLEGNISTAPAAIAPNGAVTSASPIFQVHDESIPSQIPTGPSSVDQGIHGPLDPRIAPAKVPTRFNQSKAREVLRTSDRLRTKHATAVPVTDVAPRMQKRRLRPQARTTDASNHPCRCLDQVPLQVVHAIEREHADARDVVAKGLTDESRYNALCDEHRKKYAWLATATIIQSKHCSNAAESPTIERDGTFSKRRRLSLPSQLSPNIDDTNRRDKAPEVVFVTVPEDKSEGRPIHRTASDAMFRNEVMRQLQLKMSKRAPKTWGELNDQVMYSLLTRATQPAATGAENEKEIYFLTGDEAERRLESRVGLCGPIITENQQHFRWDKRSRPIEQLFRRMGDMSRSVSVQEPSLRLGLSSFVPMQLGDVKDAFLNERTKEDPLNVLDLRNPLPRSILPSFLMGEDCQLLSRVRDTILEGHTAERCSAEIGEWNRWRDDEDWALLAKGGAHSLTHQDGCGKATWLTVQEGQVGFGWLSRPSEEDMRSWSADPNAFNDGQIRYVVLQPGQTIYFESGTVHFVFRLEQHQTLLLGGHILRWSRIHAWLQIVLDQLGAPHSTNEDLLPSAPAYVEAVAHLAEELRRLKRSDLIDEDAIIAFFSLKKFFDRKVQNGQKHP